MRSPRNPALLGASLFGFVGVGLGAFGAHALRAVLSLQALDWWHTGVEYQLIHAVVLLALSLSPLKGTVRTVALGCFSVGIVAFSGSLYLLAVTGAPVLGIITPFGGIALLAGWAALAWAAWRSRP
jgi:uncharacterized membrane protein YgdD (TMEM256/DUF423 family)